MGNITTTGTPRSQVPHPGLPLGPLDHEIVSQGWGLQVDTALVTQSVVSGCQALLSQLLGVLGFWDRHWSPGVTKVVSRGLGDCGVSTLQPAVWECWWCIHATHSD